MRTLNDVTLYELMADDTDVWVTRSNNFGFTIEIDDKEGNALVCEESVHPFAAESFADFCRRYLLSYEKISDEEDN